jgi:hypothetical protein
LLIIKKFKTNNIPANWNARGETMVHRYAIIGLIFLILILTSASAQDWRDSPLKSKTSNEWRNKSYTSKTSDSWRNSSLNSKNSRLRWNKNKWQNSKMYWRNSETTWNKKSWQDSSTYWRNSPNKWNKKQWSDNPLNWRNSDLEWKNSRKRLERGAAKQEIKEWATPKTQESPNNTEKIKEAPKAEEDLKPQIEIISIDDTISKDSSTEAAKYHTGKNNSIVMYSSDGVKQITQGEPVTKKFDDGSIVIYGSQSKN